MERSFLSHLSRSIKSRARPVENISKVVAIRRIGQRDPEVNEWVDRLNGNSAAASLRFNSALRFGHVASAKVAAAAERRMAPLSLELLEQCIQNACPRRRALNLAFVQYQHHVGSLVADKSSWIAALPAEDKVAAGVLSSGATTVPSLRQML